MLETIFSIIFSGLFFGSLYALLAVGLSLLYGVSKTINLAHGDFMMIGAYITYALYVFVKIDPVLSLLIVSGILSPISIVLYHKCGFSKILLSSIPASVKESSTLLASFGLSIILSNFIALIFTPNYQTYAYSTPTIVIPIIETKLIFTRILMMLISFFIIVMLWIVAKTTWLGLEMRCVLDDPIAAQLMGIDLNKIYLIVYVIGITTAGLAGSLFSMSYYINPYMGVEYTMAAFVAIILGGIGSIRGSLVGGLIIGLVESTLIYFTAPLLRIAVIYLILLITLWIKPTGIFRGGI